MGSVPENSLQVPANPLQVPEHCWYCGRLRSIDLQRAGACHMCGQCLGVLLDHFESGWRAVMRIRMERFLGTFSVLSRDNVLVRLIPVLKVTIAEFIVRLTR